VGGCGCGILKYISRKEMKKIQNRLVKFEERKYSKMKRNNTEIANKNSK